MNQPILLVEKTAAIVTLTLNRPTVCNALNEELITQLNHHLQEIAHDETTRVVIIQAQAKHFCAGADLQWMQTMAHGSAQQNMALLSQMLHTLYHLPQITIALAQGSAYGGGIGLIACCDIAIASKDADFCFSEVKLGLIPAVISPYILAAIGERAAKRYFVTAEKFKTQQALQIGLISEIVEHDALAECGQTLAKIIVNNKPDAVREAKRLCHHVAGEKINDKLQSALIQWIATICRSEEGQQGLNAFLSRSKQ